LAKKRRKPSGKFQRTKQFFKKRLDFKRWMSLGEIKHGFMNITSILKGVMTVPAAQHVETYEEAKSRLRLSDSQIQTRYKQLSMRSKLFFGVGVGVVFYAYYLVFHAYIYLGGVVTLFAAGPAFAMSFRDSFWAYQLKRQRLGCSIEEWIRDNFWVAKLWFRD